MYNAQLFHVREEKFVAQSNRCQGDQAHFRGFFPSLFQRSRFGLQHDQRLRMFVTVKSRIYTDNTGAYTELPVLLTSAGVLEPLLDYCLYRNHDRSLAWMTKVIRSVRMFLEYL